MAEEGSDDPEWVVATQQGLGSLIKRPKLTAPLLMKPPFRFLHDIVSEVMKSCGFADGLYDENEQQSSKIKDKESKLAYLAKIQSVVELTLGTSIDMRPAKVVAGMEPEKTNQFLQALAQAATSGGDHAAAVQLTLAKLSSADEPPPGAPPPPPPPAYDAHPDLPPPPGAGGPPGGMEMDLPPPPAGYEPQQAAPPPAPPPPPAADGALQEMASGAPPSMAAPEVAQQLPVAAEAGSKPERPNTARRAPPKVRSNEVKAERPGAADSAAVAGVILDGEDGEEEEDDTIVMVDNQGDGVDMSSMAHDKTGEGHGKLVRNLLDIKNEADLTAGVDAKKAGADADGGGADGGGIILGKKGGKNKGAALPTKSEMHTLRTAIQTLCQSSNPLGRCLEFVQEDLEAMGKELEQWRAVRRRRSSELSEEEGATESSLVQLNAELGALDAQLIEKKAQINFFKASIIRNDAKVERLLSMVVRSQ